MENRNMGMTANRKKEYNRKVHHASVSKDSCGYRNEMKLVLNTVS